MEGIRKRKRRETLFRPPRNVRKYLGHQSVTIAYSSVSGLFSDTAALGAMGTKDCWQMARPSKKEENAHIFLITSQALEKKKRREGKEGKETIP